MRTRREIVAEYEPGGRLHGYEVRLLIQIVHNEAEDENAPDWRNDNTIELWGERAEKMLAFLKTLD